MIWAPQAFADGSKNHARQEVPLANGPKNVLL